MIVIALDPGLNTGMAVLQARSDGSEAFTALEFGGDWQQLLDGMVNEVLPRLQTLNARLVGESYTVTAETLRKSRQSFSLELLGMARGFCALANATFIDPQSPADAKKFSTDAKLKRIGWWTPTKEGHANDAVRHLLLYGVRAGLIDPRRLLNA